MCLIAQQNGKDILSPGYEGSGAGAYGLAPSSSSHALQQQQHQQLAQRRSTSQSPGNRSDEGEDGDDMTILVSDAWRNALSGW